MTERTEWSAHWLDESKKSFDAWQKSISFWEADKNAGKNRNLYLTHPKFESFKIVI